MKGLEEKFRAVLDHARAVHELVEVYLDEEDLNRFVVGFVETVGHTTFTLQSLDRAGDLDGREVARIDEILRMQVGGEYLESIRVLHENRGTIFETAEPVTDAPSDTPSPSEFPANLKYAKDRKLMVTVYDLEKYQFMGFVADLGEDWVQLEPIRRNGNSNGFLLLRMEDVVRLCIAGRDEQARHFIHQARLGR